MTTYYPQNEREELQALHAELTAGMRLAHPNIRPDDFYALVDALKQARREYGAFGSLSGETLVQIDAALAKAEGR